MDIAKAGDLMAAIKLMADAWSDGWTASQVGPNVTCIEADALARVMAIAGHTEEAGQWLRGHILGDDGGDPHGEAELFEEAASREDNKVNDAKLSEYVLGLAE